MSHARPEGQSEVWLQPQPLPTQAWPVRFAEQFTQAAIDPPHAAPVVPPEQVPLEQQPP